MSANTGPVWDTSIFVRYMWRLGVAVPVGSTYDHLRAGRLEGAQLEGMTQARREDQRRQGRAQVGHYTTVFK